MAFCVDAPFYSGLVDKSSSAYSMWAEYMDDVRNGKQPRNAEALKAHNARMDRNNNELIKHIDNRAAGIGCKSVYCSGKRDSN